MIPLLVPSLDLPPFNSLFRGGRMNPRAPLADPQPLPPSGVQLCCAQQATLGPSSDAVPLCKFGRQETDAGSLPSRSSPSPRNSPRQTFPQFLPGSQSFFEVTLTQEGTPLTNWPSPSFLFFVFLVCLVLGHNFPPTNEAQRHNFDRTLSRAFVACLKSPHESPRRRRG